MFLIALLSLYVLVTAGLLLRSQAAARKFSALSWDELRSELASVSRDELESARLQYKRCKLPKEDQSMAALSRRLGRKENLSRIKKNASVIIALASYCDNFRQQSSASTVSELEGHAKILRRAIRRYQICVFFRMKHTHRQQHLILMSYEYVAMIECLLALYKENHVARYPQIRAACS